MFCVCFDFTLLWLLRGLSALHLITGHASRCWKRDDVSVRCLAWEVYCCSWAKYSIPWFGMLLDHCCSACYLLHFLSHWCNLCPVHAKLKLASVWIWSLDLVVLCGCMICGLFWCRRIWHECWWFQTFRTLSKGIKRRSSLHWRIQTSG